MDHMAEEYATGIARTEEWRGSIIKTEIENKESKHAGKVSDNIFSNIKKFQHEEYQYLNLIENILQNGVWEEGRNGKTKSIFGNSMRFSLKDGKIPILTTKKTAWKTCLKELLWFIRGETDNKLLKEQGVHIWDANTTREFLDSRGLNHYPEDIAGPCFVKETKVLTGNGYKNIENVNINDSVYTHNGNYYPVLENMKRNYSGQIYKIRPKYSPYNISCTPEHPFYARKFIVKNRFKIDGVEKRNVVFSDEPEFIKAKDLIKGKYFLGMKIEDKEIIPEFMLNGILTKLDNPNFWWMMGLFVGDGWLVYEKNNNYERNRIYFVIANHQIEEYLPKLQSVIPNILHCSNESGCKKYYSTNHEIANILKLFGKYAKHKFIPNFVHEAPKYLINNFLNGYLAADGCKRTQCTNQSLRITTISENLAFSVQRLYFKLGYIGSLQFSNREGKTQTFPNGKKCDVNNVYSFEVYKNKRHSSYSFIENGYAWITIRDIEIENVTNTEVYNLSVLNDNTYVVNNICVHNCYGYQWRNFGANYNCFSGQKLTDDEPFNGVDQLQQIIDALKDPKQRTSRRHIMTAWNPKQLDEMALPPCHVMCQFNVHDGNKLSCAMYQRSVDAILGLPFNIASYSCLTHLLAKHCGLEAYEFVHFMGNCHLYENAIDAAKLQITREPYPFPSLSIKQVRENIDDYKIEDFEVHNYISHEAIKVAMIA
jgi:thymidylate synthase